MRKSGGWINTPQAVMLLAIVLVIGEIVSRNVRARTEVDFSPAAVIKSDALTERGAYEALGWIVSTVRSSGPLEARGVGSDVLERIEAVRADGRGLEIPEDLTAQGVTVYIADTSYDETITPPYAIPAFPQRGRGWWDLVSPDEEPDKYRYYYYIRAEAPFDDGLKRVREETVYLDVDAVTGAVMDVRKFYSLNGTIK